ncbi:MAG: hypothetical protein R3339_05310 [Thermodesulfobacteriota bacterium]|nr:hypothetical protein [Thermodesulfobacteriota bacterium]
MKSIIVCFFVLLAFLAGTTGTGESTEIQLIDGSVISGEIISFKEGVYTLRSNSLGTIIIDESQIKVIRMDSQGATQWEPLNSSNESIDNTIQSLQKTMSQNPQIMEMIQALQNDPEIQSLIQDEGIMGAVSAGDINSLMANPEFIKLFENPSIKQIQKEITK